MVGGGYLPSESAEVHDVIGGGSILDVAAVNVHGVLDLTDPRLVVHRHRIHVGRRQLRHSVKHRIELWKPLISFIISTQFHALDSFTTPLPFFCVASW